jgi:uncharacterized membrane protein
MPRAAAEATAQLPRRRAWRHPVNQRMEEHQPLGQRIADRVTNFLGSWTFIVLQTAVVVAWVAGNIYLLFNFDPYPFIFLNLAFSTQAAYAAPLILLASNRAAVRDRLTLEHAAAQTDVEETQNERLLTGMTEVLRHVASVEQQVLGLEQRILELEQQIVTRFTVAEAPPELATNPDLPVPGAGAEDRAAPDGGTSAS